MIKVRRVFGVIDLSLDNEWIRCCGLGGVSPKEVFKAKVEKGNLYIHFPNGTSYESVNDARWKRVKETPVDLEKWV